MKLSNYTAVLFYIAALYIHIGLINADDDSESDEGKSRKQHIQKLIIQNNHNTKWIESCFVVFICV